MVDALLLLGRRGGAEEVEGDGGQWRGDLRPGWPDPTPLSIPKPSSARWHTGEGQGSHEEGTVSSMERRPVLKTGV